MLLFLYGPQIRSVGKKFNSWFNKDLFCSDVGGILLLCVQQSSLLFRRSCNFIFARKTIVFLFFFLAYWNQRGSVSSSSFNLILILLSWFNTNLGWRVFGSLYWTWCRKQHWTQMYLFFIFTRMTCICHRNVQFHQILSKSIKKQKQNRSKNNVYYHKTEHYPVVQL